MQHANEYTVDLHPLKMYQLPLSCLVLPPTTTQLNCCMAKAQKTHAKPCSNTFKNKKVVYIYVFHKKGFKKNPRQFKFKQLEQSTGTCTQTYKKGKDINPRLFSKKRSKVDIKTQSVAKSYIKFKANVQRVVTLHFCYHGRRF